MNCLECKHFTGEYEETYNGFVIVFCDNGKIHCTDLERGCECFEQYSIVPLREVIS